MYRRILCFLCAFALLFPLLSAPAIAAETPPYQTALNELMADSERRDYVQMMLKYYLTQDSAVRQALSDGLTAVFFFEGCSDNMEHPELHDISYYRVSAVCLGIRLDSEGRHCLSFFNQNCSTLPDRPLEFTKRKEGLPDPVGPATVRDGTYELYSVRHGGAYEALHVRTSMENGGVSAVYITPNGYVTHDATLVNVHTRTNNHILKTSMWSAGCLLVGGGDFREFRELVESTYYSLYEEFALYLPVGTVTIDRQLLKEPMYKLYGARDAVDMILANSRRVQPEKYLLECEPAEMLEEGMDFWAAVDTRYMTLPCSEETDIRSQCLGTLREKEEVTVLGRICNSRGSTWCLVEYEDRICYVYSGDLEQPGWWDRVIHGLFK